MRNSLCNVSDLVKIGAFPRIPEFNERQMTRQPQNYGTLQSVSVVTHWAVFAAVAALPIQTRPVPWQHTLLHLLANNTRLTLNKA